MNRPLAILIAGANGSGKTTFARQVLPMLHAGVAFINADEIQRQGGQFQGAVSAAREFLRLVDLATEARQPFALETTLASGTYLARIAHWRSVGYRTILHFIEVPSADFAVARVAHRVASGGHPIAEIDVRRRFARGRQLFDEVYKNAVHEWHQWYSDDQGLRFITRYDPVDS